jgi:hypothetical protein
MLSVMVSLSKSISKIHCSGRGHLRLFREESTLTIDNGAETGATLFP